jgi:twitching motility protein PilT
MAVDRSVDVFAENRHAQVRLQLADVLRAVVGQRLLPDLTGQKLVPAVELLVNTPAVAALIREGRTHQIKTYLQSGREAGMISMGHSLKALLAAGRISRQTAFAHAPDRHHLAGLVGEYQNT